MDSYNSLLLPPTFHSSSTSQTGAERSHQPDGAHLPHSTGTASAGQSGANTSKTETEGADKAKPVRKKRGQYKKTILRQQQQAAAAAAAAAAATASHPHTEPVQSLQTSNPTSSKSRSDVLSSSNMTTSRELQHHSHHHLQSSTVENLSIRQSKSGMDYSRRTALEMERELAMLAEEAEEAEENRKRRDEEAADRILKRAQVVNHLRSLKSKLASAQIQIGEDLHYQSVDLFSDIFDEVLEDIGKDNSEMLELIKKSRLDLDHKDEDIVKIEPTAEQLGHMPTRSSDRPRKRDLVSNVPKPYSGSKSGSRDQHYYQSRVLDRDDQDSDQEDSTVKRYKRNKGGEHYVGVGQSWDVGGGGGEGDDDNDTAPRSSIDRNKGNHGKTSRSGMEDGLSDDDAIKVDNHKRSYGSNGTHGIKSVYRTREDLQHQHRLELEELQLQQRKDQEEFQRRQLEQLRDLQMRQNEEFRAFEAAKAKRYRERMGAVTDKRTKSVQPSHPLGLSRSNKTSRSQALSYEFDNGFEHHSGEEYDDSSSSRSPSPSPPPVSSRSRETFSSSSGSLVPNRGTPAPRPRQNLSKVQSLPMSTMTMALTAMNEKKKQMKRAQRKQPDHDEEHDDHDQSDESAEESDYRQHADAKNSRSQQFSNGAQKRTASDNPMDTRKRSASLTPSARSASSYNSRIQYEPTRSSSGSISQPKHSARETSMSDRYDRQFTPRSSGECHTPSSKPRTKKQKHDASTSEHANDHSSEQDQTTSKSAIGFNKTLLSHFERWNPDTKTENFFDFVLSDPPDVEVDESEVEGLLSRVKPPTERAQPKDMNVTPTSNAFRWYQEQQRLAQELARQPKIKPLSFENLIDDEHNGASALSTIPADPSNPFGGKTSSEELTLGVDPLAAFTLKNRKEQKETQSPVATMGLKHGVPESKEAGVSMNQIPDSSPMIGSSPAMNMLYSDDGEHDWGFNPFMVDSTDEYVHQDSPLQSDQASGDFELPF
ncbi:hypothetical protein BGZ83_011845 [Gryganskiella cystojenkinii]|nr:hypothetical protein BGZ83_011845 [Gryganskiella cystojenkinii]